MARPAPDGAGRWGIFFEWVSRQGRPLASMETKSPSATMMWSSRRMSMVARASRTCRVAAVLRRGQSHAAG